MHYDVDAIRTRFPALAAPAGARPRVFLDNPAGTQVPRVVLDRVADAMVRTNANLGGRFATSRLAAELVTGARAAAADLLGAASADEVVFGQNMTALTLHLSRAIAPTLREGDEIVVTRMDHDANVAPWLLVARDRGCTVRWLDFDPATYEYRYDDLDGVITERTRVVAVGHASNVLGTLNDVPAVVRAAHRVGAVCFVDAVQSAPHVPLDVQALGCDALAWSAYKVYGPHQGVLWGRRELLERLEPYRVRCGDESIPHRWETGTIAREALAGTLGAIEHLEWVGARWGTAPADPGAPGIPGAAPAGAPPAGRRARLLAGLRAIEAHERHLTRRLIDGLLAIEGLTLRGIADRAAADRRVPTVSFTHPTIAPRTFTEALAHEGIAAWDGHNYAWEPIQRLGLHERGGVVRLGIAHYNTADEVDRALAVIGDVVVRGLDPGG
jgi:cysteine desulfurase family protein (TIGR01976 family)